MTSAARYARSHAFRNVFSAALRAPHETAHGELDTLSTLLYCSAQFAPDRPQS